MLFVYIFIGLVTLILIISAILPKTFNIEKTIVIDRPTADVMSRVADLNYYSKWNPWQQSDATATSKITGMPATPGHQYSWVGKKVGVGSLTLQSIDQGHIHFDLEFIKPWKSKAKDNWAFESIGNGQTKLIWQNRGQLPWPIASLMGPLIIKNLNYQFDQGLANLKNMCEKESF
jgi:hypothetical protein